MVYDAGLISDTLLGRIIHIVFGSERNFLNVGLFYMCIGNYFARRACQFDRLPLLGLFIASIVIKTLETRYLNIAFMQAICAVIVFLLLLNTKMDFMQHYSLRIRKISTGIYLFHFPFILIFDYYLKRGTMIDFAVTICFAFVCSIILIKIFPPRVSDLLLGN